MNPNYLDFEQPIAELEAKIEELRYVGDDSEINIGDEISKLEEKERLSDRGESFAVKFESIDNGSDPDYYIEGPNIKFKKRTINVTYD